MDRSGRREIVRADRHSDGMMGGVAGHLFTDDPPMQMVNREACAGGLLPVANRPARCRSRVMMCV
jgi:hypothetical protein